MEETYSEEGQQQYHPALLLKVMLYGFALVVRSSRKLVRRVRETDAAALALAGGARLYGRRQGPEDFSWFIRC